MGNSYKIPFELGTWAGLVAFACFLLIWLTPYSPLGMFRYVGFWIPILFIFLAVYRQMKANGTAGLTFGNAFMVGMFTVLILGALKAVLVYMMVEYVDHTIIPHAFDEMISRWENMANIGLSQEYINEQIEMALLKKEEVSTLDIAKNELNYNCLGGIPISLLAALIFNRKPKNA